VRIVVSWPVVEVALDPRHVLEHRIALGQQVDDRRHRPVGVNALLPIGKVQVRAAYDSHGSAPSSWTSRRRWRSGTSARRWTAGWAPRCPSPHRRGHPRRVP